MSAPVDLTRHPIRAHQISRFRYCAEMSRLNVVDGIQAQFVSNEPIEKGIALHEWLSNRPLSTAETGLEGRLTEYARTRDWFDTTDVSKQGEHRYFIRMYKGCRIKVHPDDIMVRWDDALHKSVVALREYKGTTSLSSAQNPFSNIQYEWQLRTYIYVMRPIIESLGYTFAVQHPIAYYNRNNGDFVVNHPVFALSDSDYEIQLETVFAVWRGAEPPKPPKWFKCRDCPLVFKSKCKIRQQWLDSKGGFFVEDADKRGWTELKEPEDALGPTKGSDPLEFEDLWRLGLGQ